MFFLLTVRKSVGPTASAPAVAASTAFNGANKRGSFDAAVPAEDVPESDKKDSKEAESAAVIVRGKERNRRVLKLFSEEK